MTESTVRLLSDLRQITGEGLLFPRPDGRQMNPDKFDAEVWAPITAAAGFTGMRFHDLRHFYASQLIAQGETAAYVRDQLGHSSIQVTFDTYGHLFPGARHEASARFEKAMAKARKKVKTEAAVSNPLAIEGEGDEKKRLLIKHGGKP